MGNLTLRTLSDLNYPLESLIRGTALAEYSRRTPEETLLYRVVQENLETFLADAEGLETESRLGLHGHERGNPGHSQDHDLRTTAPARDPTR